MQARIEGFIAQCRAHAIPCSAFHFGSGYSSIDGKRYTFNWNRCSHCQDAIMLFLCMCPFMCSL